MSPLLKPDSRAASTYRLTWLQGWLITPCGSVYSVSGNADASTPFLQGLALQQALIDAGFTVSGTHMELGCDATVAWIPKD
jgi:hypothetical protein